MIKYSDLKNKLLENKVETPIVEEYEINEEALASSIKENHNIEKITNTLVENYRAIIESNSFYIDPVVQEFSIIDSHGKYRYTLADDNIIAITEETQDLLVRLLHNKPDIVNYMQESINNFMEILRKI